MKKSNDFTEGNIFTSLFKFALPVMLALFLQSLYGAVDLFVVGKYASTPDVSGVATGSMLMHTVTTVITGLSMGITVLVGRRIGEKRPELAGKAIGAGIALFTVMTVILTILVVLGAEWLSMLMKAPEEAFCQTVDYTRICGVGMIFIIAYNVLGSVFRGIGDSTTPLITVAVACVVNIVGDLLFVAVFDMGTAGAAYATILAQAISVIISLLIIRKKQLPFEFSLKDIKFEKNIIKEEVKIGAPVALQDLLVGMSFLVIQAIVNSIDVIASAATGVGSKVCSFLMLVPSAYSMSMSAFVAQNLGAQKPERAKKALYYGIVTSLVVGGLMAWLSIGHGDLLASIFDEDPAVIEAAHSYLKAYGIDCLMTPFLFCFMGYYNGHSKTVFVMLQGLIGAFCVRIPVAFLMSLREGVQLFDIAMATPASTIVQIIMCITMFVVMHRKNAKNKDLSQIYSENH